MPEQRHTAKLSSAHHWEISYAITRAFGESADDSPPIAAILQLLTDRLNWDVGALWVVNELHLVLECIELLLRHGPRRRCTCQNNPSHGEGSCFMARGSPLVLMYDSSGLIALFNGLPYQAMLPLTNG